MTQAVELMPEGFALDLPNDLARLRAGWLMAYRSENTRKAYGRDLDAWLTFCAGLNIDPLDPERAHVDAYARYLETEGKAPATDDRKAQGKAPASVARAIASISAFYSWAEDEGYCRRNPAAKVKRPALTDESPTLGLDKTELAAFLEAATEAGPRDEALLRLLAVNGLRIGEALALDCESITEQRGHHVVRVIAKGGRRIDAVPLPASVMDAIGRMLDGRTEGPLFQDDRGRRLNSDQARRIVARIAKKAGISKRISPHSLRHSCVTAALDAGASLRDVQDLARHSDPRTTRRYDRGRGSLDRHASYRVAAFIAGES